MVTHRAAGFTLDGNRLVCGRWRADAAAAWEATSEGHLLSVREDSDEEGADVPEEETA